MKVAAIDAALDALEKREFEALSWGYVDGAVSRDEALALIAAELQKNGDDSSPDEVLETLLENRLAREFTAGDRYSYRTRFGELVRLLVRMRQWFVGQDWRAAAQLVSDFRVDLRRRRYPKRDIASDDALVECAAHIALTSLQKELWRVLAADGLRLSRFQVDAALRLLAEGRDIGTIITAGTGSGKTLAFYQPALLATAETLGDNSDWVRVLALYPRQELLKDQYSEVYRLSLKLDQTLRAHNRRRFTLGALYNATPYDGHDDKLVEKGWRSTSTGHVCPTLRCPSCNGDLTWRNADRDRDIDRLTCLSRTCGFISEVGALRLTRASINKAPPDFLFTTTEMLNQRLSDTHARRLFGIGQRPERKPLFVLLDEVHTYFGTTGAQTALVLRRWRHLLRAPVRWVGLSATLRDAGQFFADLCGIKPDASVEVTPSTDAMEFEGAEYQIILRGNPAEQKATLSTSIQTTMLLARMLDPPTNRPEHRRFGRRVFAFTDDLDVTHRFFDDLRDAEAYRFGRPDLGRVPLAALRASGADQDQDTAGQMWRLAETLRGSLVDRLVIGRTTSRDPGVESAADVIVATAALEVGFNDPEVGAVLQHKAPRNFASYLQRRGRAGRQRWMRPISVTILSDYGRDRTAFQSYEHLFEPEIESQSLPVRNLYVLRIQAVFALFDWIAGEAAMRSIAGWSWDVLSAPGSRNEAFISLAKEKLRGLVQLEPETLRAYRDHLKGALQLDDPSVDAVLWERPRSVLLEAIPTLVRRLFCNWQLAGGEGLDLHIRWHPLPDFVPRTLFSELNLPEVRFTVPPAWANREATEETMPIVQALQQFAPGRIRRRFADERADQSHWFPLDSAAATCSIPVRAYAAEHEYVGTFRGTIGNEPCNIPVYRPWRVVLEKPPADVLAHSNSFWDWQTDFAPRGDPLRVKPPALSHWATVFPSLESRLHRFNGGLSVRRFAAGGRADIRRKSGSSEVTFSLVDNTDGDPVPAAIGFEYEADALEVPTQLPDPSALAVIELPEGLRRSLYTMRFKSLVLQDLGLPADINGFQRDWLHQLVLLAIARRCARSSVPVATAISDLSGRNGSAILSRIIAPLVIGEDRDEDDDDEAKLEATLRKLVAREDVTPRLADLARQAFVDPTPGWGEWLHGRLLGTLSEAVLEACLIATPRESVLEGLTVDLRRGDDHQNRIVVAETTLGGGGTIEALTQRFSAEPSEFFAAFEAALAPSDLETASDSLARVYVLLAVDVELTDALANLRTASDHSSREAARRTFMSRLSHVGLPLGHALSVSIATRLLRPNSGPVEDQLIKDLLHSWSAAETALGFSMPLRVATATLAADAGLAARLADHGGPGRELMLASVLLFPRGAELRQHALQSYNPFRSASLTDAALVRAVLLQQHSTTVAIGAPDWVDQAAIALSTRGTVVLRASGDNTDDLAAALMRMSDCPVSLGVLHLFPAVEKCGRNDSGEWTATLVLRERM